MDKRNASQSASPIDDLNLGELAKDKVREAYRKRGRANVLIAGRTGVGNSTLTNSVFKGKLARTGQGRPVTTNTREYTKGDTPLSVFDTRGQEMADFMDTLASLESFVTERLADPDPNRHIHVAWVCIAEDLRRVEEAKTELTAMLAKQVPVVGVITKARSDQGFRDRVQRLLPTSRNVVRVRSIPEVLDEGHTIPPMGLEDLVLLTMELFLRATKTPS